MLAEPASRLVFAPPDRRGRRRPGGRRRTGLAHASADRHPNGSRRAV